MFILLIQTTSWNQLLTMDFQWLFLENLSILWVLFSDEILILLYVSVIIKTIETYHSVVHLNKDFVMNLAKYSSMIKKWILFIFKSTCRSGKYTLSFVILCCINYMYFLFSFFAANALKNQDGIVYNSIVYFTNHVTENPNGPAPLKLRKIIDMVKITFNIQQ